MKAQLQNKIAIAWLQNAVIALGIAGVYSIIIVTLRVPQLAVFVTDTDIFKSALIVHVNLSVLVWMLSICCVIWSYNARYIFLNVTCARYALFGTILMAISPFCVHGAAIMNNYIPMLENIVFVVGLVLFICCVLICGIIRLYEYFVFLEGVDDILITFAIISSIVIFIVACICTIISFFALEESIYLISIDLALYYELLYWAGGHILQFLFCQILIIVWILLLQNTNISKTKFTRLYLLLLTLNMLFALSGLYGLCYNVTSWEFKSYYTEHMRYCGGIAPLMAIGLAIYEQLSTTANKNFMHNAYYNVAKASLIASITLFIAGGVIGVLISGTNVTIPAHYHGCVIGITIAFMGFAYLIAPGNVVNKRAPLQIYLTTTGQILHIFGLAMAGGYGVLRKTTSTELAFSAKVYMGIMGCGGMIAIIGGLMFVVICGKSSFCRKSVTGLY